jgi:hypothetical protein
MPIASVPPIPTAPRDVSQVDIQEPRYKHSIVDTQITSYAALISHIQGSSYIVDYYSQVVSTDEQLMDFQPNSLAVYQQYRKIVKMELKLQGSLNTSFDADTHTATVTGTAIVYPFIRPNKGDAFIADIGDGRAGQFTVTESGSLSILNETCYEISFMLARYADENITTLLDNRVVDTVYFEKDFLTYGQNPVLTSEEMANVQRIDSLDKDLLTHWLGLFTSQHFRTILLPGQERPVYDSYVINALFSVLNIDEDIRLKRIGIKNVEGLHPMSKMDFWTALIYTDENRLYDCFKRYMLASAQTLDKYPVFNSIRYSGIGYFIYPNYEHDTVDSDYRPLEAGQSTLLLRSLQDSAVDLASLTFNNALKEFLEPVEPASNIYLSDEVPSIHPVTVDDGYVLSLHFYNDNVDGMSKLELMVRDYFKTQSVQLPLLFSFAESIRHWGRLEKFYYIPILIMLLKYAKRTL